MPQTGHLDTKDVVAQTGDVMAQTGQTGDVVAQTGAMVAQIQERWWPRQDMCLFCDG